MLRNIFGQKPMNKVGFEDILLFLKSPKKDMILINTLPVHEQEVLIEHTTNIIEEETIINEYLRKSTKMIIIYGKNCVDNSVETKYSQIINLGYCESNLYIYYGGLFEWCLLQDIYDTKDFPTTNVCCDILKFRPDSVIDKKK